MDFLFRSAVLAMSVATSVSLSRLFRCVRSSGALIEGRVLIEPDFSDHVPMQFLLLRQVQEPGRNLTVGEGVALRLQLVPDAIDRPGFVEEVFGLQVTQQPDKG